MPGRDGLGSGQAGEFFRRRRRRRRRRRPPGVIPALSKELSFLKDFLKTSADNKAPQTKSISFILARQGTSFWKNGLFSRGFPEGQFGVTKLSFEKYYSL